jgi:hypothetical protein
LILFRVLISNRQNMTRFTSNADRDQQPTCPSSPTRCPESPEHCLFLAARCTAPARYCPPWLFIRRMDFTSQLQLRGLPDPHWNPGATHRHVLLGRNPAVAMPAAGTSTGGSFVIAAKVLLCIAKATRRQSGDLISRNGAQVG